jgi:uncharacterized protein (DUF4415 family)
MTENSIHLSAEQFERLKRLSDLGDAGIDLSYAPEVTDRTTAKPGLFCPGPGDKVAVGLDSDVAAWFESRSSPGEESEERINQALRAYVAEAEMKAG